MYAENISTRTIRQCGGGDETTQQVEKTCKHTHPYTLFRFDCRTGNVKIFFYYFSSSSSIFIIFFERNATSILKYREYTSSSFFFLPSHLYIVYGMNVIILYRANLACIVRILCRRLFLRISYRVIFSSFRSIGARDHLHFRVFTIIVMIFSNIVNDKITCTLIISNRPW